jgi:hypothetical protein
MVREAGAARQFHSVRPSCGFAGSLCFGPWCCVPPAVPVVQLSTKCARIRRGGDARAYMGNWRVGVVPATISVNATSQAGGKNCTGRAQGWTRESCPRPADTG